MINEQENLEEVLEEETEFEQEEPETERADQVEQIDQEEPEQPQERRPEEHPNFRQIRRQNKELYQRNTQLEESLKRLEQKLTEDADQYEDPETRKLKKMEAVIQRYEEQEKQKEQERRLMEEAKEAEEVLADIYDDFNVVYNKRNINDFYDKYPSIERRVQNKWKRAGYEEAAEYAYKLMKQKGYGEENVRSVEKSHRISKNAKKPQRSAAMSQVSNAHRESLMDEKARVREETDRIIRGY